MSKWGDLALAILAEGDPATAPTSADDRVDIVVSHSPIRLWTLKTLTTADRRAGFEERAAIIEEGSNVPRAWAEAFAQLELSGRDGLDSAGRALDTWAVKADAFGWRPAELLSLALRGEVIALTAESATLRIGETVRHVRRSVA